MPPLALALFAIVTLPSPDILTLDIRETAEALRVRFEARKDAIALTCGRSLPVDPTVKLRIDGRADRPPRARVVGEPTRFAECFARALTPGSSPIRATERFTMRQDFDITPPAAILRARLHALDLSYAGSLCLPSTTAKPTHLFVRLVTDAHRLRLDVRTEPHDPSVTACFESVARAPFSGVLPGAWGVDETRRIALGDVMSPALLERLIRASIAPQVRRCARALRQARADHPARLRVGGRLDHRPSRLHIHVAADPKTGLEISVDGRAPDLTACIGERLRERLVLLLGGGVDGLPPRQIDAPAAVRLTVDEADGSWYR